jgi:hypothetical protein
MWRRALGAIVDPTLDEQVFTDWPEVDQFAEDFLRFATAARAKRPMAQVSSTA